MSERRWGNFSSCCRLCLSEKLGTLKSIFEDAALGKDVVFNIHECVGVEIKPNDKLSTMICEKCTGQVNAWRSFKDACFENQSKLVGWMNDWTSCNGGEDLNLSIRIKDEVLDESDTNQHPDITDDDNEIRVKTEPIEAIYHVETEMADDSYDYPPPLSPEQLVETSFDHVEIEMDGSIQIMNGSVTELPENARVSADGKSA